MLFWFDEKKHNKAPSQIPKHVNGNLIPLLTGILVEVKNFK